MKRTLIMLAVVGMVSFVAVCFAQDLKSGAKSQIKKEIFSSDVKEIEGTISAINDNGIAVVFNKDAQKGSEEEMYIPIEKSNIRLIHKSSLKEMEIGDTVKVGFKEVTDEIEGKESKRFQATTVAFLKKADKKPEPQDFPAQEEADQDDGSSAPEAAQTIPLKGFKED
jgi:hypothetical protein